MTLEKLVLYDKAGKAMKAAERATQHERELNVSYDNEDYHFRVRGFHNRLGKFLQLSRKHHRSGDASYFRFSRKNAFRGLIPEVQAFLTPDKDEQNFMRAFKKSRLEQVLEIGVVSGQKELRVLRIRSTGGIFENARIAVNHEIFGVGKPGDVIHQIALSIEGTFEDVENGRRKQLDAANKLLSVAVTQGTIQLKQQTPRSSRK